MMNICEVKMKKWGDLLVGLWGLGIFDIMVLTPPVTRYWDICSGAFLLLAFYFVLRGVE